MSASPGAEAPIVTGAIQTPSTSSPGSPVRILMVTPYPPVRDGIGTFALQQVQALRRAGNHVEVCSPQPSAAHHHLDLHGPRGAVALRRLMAGFDRVIIQFHPDFFYEHPATPSSRISTGLALAAAFRSGPPVTIRLHEVDRRWVASSDPSAFATRAVFRAASRIEVHSPDDQAMMTDEFKVPSSRVVLVDHGTDFISRTTADRATARRSLGLDPDDHVFLCIGFVQPHKGFDRAAAAFRGLADRGASLHIVGSVRIDDPTAADHERELEALESQIPGVHLHLGYLSDEAFDRWIVAADTVVLPYRHIWSSGVVERARLLNRPVIATRVGSLAHQLAGDPSATLVDDNLELAAAMRSAVVGLRTREGGGTGAGAEESDHDTAGTGDSVSSPVSNWTFDGPIDRDSVMAEINRRSAANRGVINRGGPNRRSGGDQPATAALPLRRLRPVPPPPATSARPGVSTIKKLIRRVIAWEVDPLREQLVRLQKASLQAAETTDARLDELTVELDDGRQDR